jgi:hypothetical protein
MLEKLKAFWKNKVVPFWNKVVSLWKIVVEALTSDSFVYVFPLAVFALLAFILQSVILVIICFVWLIPIVHYANKKE